MNILISGSRGQLGYELLTQAKKKSSHVLGVDLPELDITNEERVTQTFDHFMPSVIINAAAYTNVDQAEKDHEIAFSVNRDAPLLIAKYCKKNDIPLIHISTDYVFDGKNEIPYSESDPISPVGVYGLSKAEGEKEIRNVLKKHIIIRTAWLYSTHGQNFLHTMLKLGREKKVIKVVADQQGSPTCAADLAEVILYILNDIPKGGQQIWGTYHYTGKGITSWHGFAESIFDFARSYINLKITKVKPVTTADYPTLAKRPAFSALDCDLIRKTFNIQTKPWQKSLNKTIKTIFSND